MLTEEKLKYMRVLGNINEGDADDDLLTAYLDLAKEKLLNHIYPFEKPVEVGKEYEMKQVELAIILFAKRGAEGEDSHNENGVNRKYQSEEKFLQSIPRCVGIPK